MPQGKTKYTFARKRLRGSGIFVYNGYMTDDVHENHMVSTRLPEEVVAQIDQLAARQHNSRSGVVRQALDLFFASRAADAGTQEGGGGQ